MRFHTTLSTMVETSGVDKAEEAKQEAIRTIKSRLYEYGLDYIEKLFDITVVAMPPGAFPENVTFEQLVERGYLRQ